MASWQGQIIHTLDEMEESEEWIGTQSFMHLSICRMDCFVKVMHLFTVFYEEFIYL